MPLEGHWERVHTPLRSTGKRERRVVVIGSALLALALVIAVYAALHSGSSKTSPGCLDVVGASSMGGATYHACGRAAARWCRSVATRDDAVARRIQEHCRNAGYR